MQLTGSNNRVLVLGRKIDKASSDNDKSLPQSFRCLYYGFSSGEEGKNGGTQSRSKHSLALILSTQLSHL